MPLPTPGKPWSQVDWLFDMQADLARSKSTFYRVCSGKKHFINYIRSTYEMTVPIPPYYVNDEFDEYTLLRFKQYIDDLNISSSHAALILSVVRQVFETAIGNRWIELKSFIDFVLPTASRETDLRAPYTVAETAAILKALNEDIHRARKVLRPYAKTGLGKAPNLKPNGQGGMRREDGWWDSEDNMRWYFENELNCQAITKLHPGSKGHKNFLLKATDVHGGLHALYARWGVSAWIGQELIQPYIYKLVAETGLNPSVALALRVEDYYESHPLTKRPYIRYWKERGSGEGELHVGLIDSGVLTLDDQQAQNIKRIWEEVRELTDSFRHELPSVSRNLLFVYQSRAVRWAGQARSFLTDAGNSSYWAKDFVSRHKLLDVNGRPLSLNLSRFRPSLVSRMLKRGVDIYIIQSVLGHRSVMTTLRYIDSYDFNPVARKEVQKALEQIRENRQQQENVPKYVADNNLDIKDVIYTTGLAFCKNVFMPPENIRKAGGVDIGSPCTFFNMCLRCPNVLIMQEHLPQLFALRRQYLVAMDQGLSTTTHRAAIQQNLQILNSLLDFETSDWPNEVLAKAERQSEFIDSAVDPVAIRAVLV